MPLTERDEIRIRQYLQRLESGLMEGMQAFATYHDSNLAATPSDPTGDGTSGGWHWEPTEDSNWMSVKTAHKVTLGTWGTPIRVFGLQGTETAGVGMSDDVPKLSKIKFVGDGVSKVGWTPGTVEYGGNSYAIDVKSVGDANTDTFIYWDDADGQTSFKTTNLLATAIAANHHYVCRNDSGVATPVWIKRIILGGVIQANTLTASTAIIAKTVTSSELSDSVNAAIANNVKTFYQADVPTAEHASDIWFDTNDGLKMHRATSAGDNEVVAGEWEHVDLTKIDGGNILTSTILAASIATYNLTAANATFESAIIETAHIKNLNVTTDKLQNLNVTTPKINNEATSVREDAYTSGSISISGGETIVQTLSNVNTEGYPVTITANMNVYNNDIVERSMQVKIKEGVTTKSTRYTPIVPISGWTSSIVAHSYTPTAGDKTYTVTVTGVCTGDLCSERILSITSDKGK